MATTEKKTQTAAAEETAQPAIDIAALTAEITKAVREQIEAEQAAAQQAADQAESAEARARDAWLEELVQVQLFKDGKDYKDDVYVAVNGENCLIRRGVPVWIKRKFALVIEQSQRQDVSAAESAEDLQREFRETALRYDI